MRADVMAASLGCGGGGSKNISCARRVGFIGLNNSDPRKAVERSLVKFVSENFRHEKSFFGVVWAGFRKRGRQRGVPRRIQDHQRPKDGRQLWIERGDRAARGS